VKHPILRIDEEKLDMSTFIRRTFLKMSISQPLFANPDDLAIDGQPANWQTARNFQLKIYRDRSLCVNDQPEAFCWHVTVGSSHKAYGRSFLEECLHELRLNALMHEHEPTFELWCSSMDHDVDSRRMFRMWELERIRYAALKKFMGHLWQVFLYAVLEDDAYGEYLLAQEEKGSTEQEGGEQ
jgi:hypothetical protein